MTRRRLSFLAPLPLLVAGGLLFPVTEAPPETRTSAGEIAYRELPELPQGAAGVGQAAVETTALELAAALKAVPLQEGADELCPADRLEISWTEPGPEYVQGAFVTPLGPAPTDETTEVNGIVLCRGSAFAFMGFEARYEAGRWDVVAVPYVDEDDEESSDHPADSAPVAAPTPQTSFGSDIEGYAAYEPQRTCDASAKPGTVALRNLLLNGNPGSRNLGIVRGCGIGGRSEHKEGRAFDWGVSVSRPAEKAAADSFVAQLLATDSYGNPHALARRMGVMYMIWNRQIWTAYRADAGWRPYSGVSPHTDHIHISLSWAGAQGRTSYWSGQVAEGITFASGTGGGGGGGGGGDHTVSTRPIGSSRPSGGGGGGGGHRDGPTAEQRAAWEAERARRRAEREAREEAWRAEREEHREAAESLSEEERRRRREAREAREEAWREEIERRREREAERREEAEEAAEDRRDAEETERERRRAEREAREQAWRAEIERRRQAEEERRRRAEEQRQQAPPPAHEAAPPPPPQQQPPPEQSSGDGQGRHGGGRRGGGGGRRWTPPAPPTTVPAPAPAPAPAPEPEPAEATAPAP